MTSLPWYVSSTEPKDTANCLQIAYGSELVACLKRLRRRPLKFYTLFVDFRDSASYMIPSCGSPGDLVSCLAVGKLPDDALSKQALLIEFKRKSGE